MNILELTENQERDELQTPNYSFKVDNPSEITEILSDRVEGLDESELEYVPGFTLKHTPWLEKISQDLLNLPHISDIAYNQPESVCDIDNREKIPNTTIAPWKFICRLYITTKDNAKYVASGFFIGRRCIITNGHVVYIHNRGGWVKEITVVPGQNADNAPYGGQKTTNFVTVKGWTSQQNADYDYGAVFLSDDTLFNRVRGYMGFQILNSSMLINNSGYPADKEPKGTQWFNAGPVTRLSDRRFFYLIDTFGGQSGSPVWVQNGANRYTVGVHAHGGCPNKAVRTIRDVANNWNTWRNR